MAVGLDGHLQDGPQTQLAKLQQNPHPDVFRGIPLPCG
jgi:hypothetical protein